MKPIRELITGLPVLTLSESATAFEAALAMSSNKVGCVLVTGAEDHPAGIFTERDLMTRIIVHGKDPKAVQLSEVMTRELFTVEPTHRLHAARGEMDRRHIRHLPVVEDGKVVCILSLRDILRADLKDQEKDLEAMNAYIHGEIESAPVLQEPLED